MQIMKHTLRFLLLFASMAAIGALSSHAAINVSGLRCEDAVNPLGIDAAKPRLSWLLTSSERGQAQTAYQILVASDKDKLRSDQADIWDSGKVVSDQSIQVLYKGPTLSSRQRYFWKVRVWDKSGVASTYSESAFWEMALLSPRDWKAHWIGFTGGWLGRALYFRSDLTLAKPVRRARVYVSGIGYYELRLNGIKVGDNVLDPGFTDYTKRVLYATYDVGSELKTGHNVIGVTVGNGWWNRPQLLLQLEVTYTDGSDETFGTLSSFNQNNGTWRVTSGPILTTAFMTGRSTMPGLRSRDGTPWSETRIGTAIISTGRRAGRFPTPSLVRVESWFHRQSIPSRWWIPFGLFQSRK